MHGKLSGCLWPLDRLSEGVQALAARSGMSVRSEAPEMPSGPDPDEARLRSWLGALGDWLHIEIEAATFPYSGLDTALAAAGPAVLSICMDSRRQFLLLVGGRSRRVSLLRTDLRVQKLPARMVAAALSRDLEASRAASIAQLLDSAGLQGRRRARVGSAILNERLAARQIGGCWFLRLPQGANFWRHLRRTGVPGRAILLAGAHLVQDLLWIAAWWVLGAGALQGRLDRGWIGAWLLLVATMIPCRVLAVWLQGRIAISAGGALKQRLLAGALELEPDEIRSQGAGQLLGRVLESQQVESLALSGGFLALVAGVELALASIVLFSGGVWQAPVVLVLWVAGTIAVAWRYFSRNSDWAGARLAMTHELVERMVGHRTRLAQEAPGEWHAGEDQSLERYLDLSRGMDRTAALLTAYAPRGWSIAAIAVLAPAFVSGADAAALGISLGGVLLAYRALKRLVGGLWQIAGATIAWQRTSPLFHAAKRSRVAGSPLLALTPESPGDDTAGPLLEASDLTFRYPRRSEPVFRGSNLRVYRGERVLLEGPSGGGKSTLASVIGGLRVADSGLLLLKGLDRHTLGANGWRRAVASAPQFHENHVLTATFAFNLLMGRHWPPEPGDFEEMELLCRELGLGDLLERMPAGLLQSVGDTGWQLSHGERSRLYIARALAQKADLVILDESFAALDPENLQRAVDCVISRSETLLVIAHP